MLGALTLTNSGTIQGGDGGGGAGGKGDTADTGDGIGGHGGAGVLGNSGATITNSGTIRGGNGGAGGSASAGGNGGNGGDGISGSGLTITNSGTIIGGLGGAAGSGSAGANGNAITFTSGTNVLELQAGSVITGNVDATAGASNTFVLGGAANWNLDASAIGTQYLGFQSFQVNAASSAIWTLQNAPTVSTPWQLLSGTLSVGSSSALGDASSSPLTFNGGTLQVTGTSFSDFGTRAITWGANGGGFDIADPGNTFTVSQVLGGTGSGTDQLIKNGLGTLNLTAANTYTGPTTINAGTLLVNGSITSSTLVNPGATLGGAGMITGDVTNAGIVAPGAGPGQIGALTITGNYIGNNGVLAIQSVLGDDSSSTDQLILNGGNASGSTSIRVQNLGGAGAQTTNGIEIIAAQNGATTNPGAFSLAGPVGAGLYQYLLFQGPPAGGSGDANSWYLRSTLDNPNPPNPPIPIYRPEGSIYATMAGVARSLTNAAIGNFHDRNGDQGLVRGEGEFNRAWARLFGQSAELGHRGTLNARFDGNMGGVQAGIDLYRSAPGAYESRAGFFGTYAQSRGDVNGFALGRQDAFAGTAQVEAFSVGGYWTQMGVPGWYIDTVVLGSRFDGTGKSTNQVGVRTTGFGVAASVEAGYPIPLGGGIHIEPQAQLVYQHLDFNDTADVFSTVAHDTSHGLAGRLGLRLAADSVFMGARVSPFLKASVWHDWTGTDRVVFANAHVVDARQRGTSVEVGGGVVAHLTNTIGLWASADYTTDVDGDGEREIVRGNVGMRWVW